MVTDAEKKARSLGPADYRQAAALEKIADTLEEEVIPLLRQIHDELFQIRHKK